MIDAKEATQIAIKYFKDLYSDHDFSNILLEEVEFDEVANAWLITIGFTDLKGLGAILEIVANPISPIENRQYKVFSINARTGKVISMKIRWAENA